MSDDIKKFIADSRAKVDEFQDRMGELSKVTGMFSVDIAREMDIAERRLGCFANDALPAALDMLQAQQKQIAQRDLYYHALCSLAYGEKPECVLPDWCGKNNHWCKACSAYRQITKRQSLIETLTLNLKGANDSLEEEVTRLVKQIAEQQAEIVRLEHAIADALHLAGMAPAKDKP